MSMLTKLNFEKAERFIRENGRPLEKALYNYYFKNGCLDDVLMELSKYQNEDGGFGHSLESDVRLVASNPLATSVAFQKICELNVGADSDMVKRGIDYLVKNYKASFRGWLFFPPEVDNVPRAIWWNYDANPDNTYNGNPSAEIAGYLERYRELAPQHIVDEAIAAAMEQLEKSIDTMVMHEIFCYKRMAKELPQEQGSAILEKLAGRIRSVIEFNTDKWAGYAARPLSFVQSPSSEFAKVVSPEELDINLDYLIKEQWGDGSWVPRWDWCRFEDEWKLAEHEWKGVITLENLRILKAFGRIEE